MPSKINLNISPYFDDFDENKDYYKVLFKPGVSVQSRELTTLQSILQNQIEKFGKNFFEDGAMVIPGQLGYDSNYTCVEIDSNHLGVPVSIYLNYLKGKEIKGKTSGVVATIDGILLDIDSERKNNTLYVKYTTTGTNGETTFVDGEDLLTTVDIDYGVSTIAANSSVATTIITNSTSIGSVCKITNGVYFIRGYFVSVETESLILDQYSSNPSYRVGLKIEEDIAIASSDNPDLYDNAQGFKNYTAPGADRLRIRVSLHKKLLTDLNDDNFIELLKVEDGDVKRFVKQTQYNILREELARRTYDESGNYSVTPYNITVRDSLDNLIGNNGIYVDTQTTPGNQTPSDNLAIVNISPGKSYVKGYELENISTTPIDYPKARDTSQETNSVSFNMGKKFILDNVENGISLGFGTDNTVNLLDSRTTIAGLSSSLVIGTSNLYNLSLVSYGATQTQNRYEVTLYDIQTYATLGLNNNIVINAPAFIEGTKSNASGYLVSNVSAASSTITLTQVSGNFIIQEPIKINGSETYLNPATNSTQRFSVFTFKNYTLDDVKQVVKFPSSGIGTFRGDFNLSKRIDVSDLSATFTFSPASNGIGTFAAGNDVYKKVLKVGDIISYTKPNETIETFNRVIRIGGVLSGIGVQEIPSVVGICSGTVGVSTFTVTGIKKRTLEILNPDTAFLYAKLPNSPVAGIVTTQRIEFTRSYNVVIPAVGPYTRNADQGVTFSSYDIKKYNLTYESGLVETDLSGSITGVPKINITENQITLNNLSSSGNAILTVTYIKPNPIPKNKIFNRCNSIIISRTANQVEQLGLSTSNIYGTRIEDKQISLNVCDVSNVLGIYQSSTANNPLLPSALVSNISSPVSNLVKGELIVGSNSKAVASFVETTSPNSISFVYRNNFTFIPGEQIEAKESKITGEIGSVTDGDQNITNNFTLDDGQRSEYLDFSRIIRKSNSTTPTGKIRIIFDNYTIKSGSNGDFVAKNSYEDLRYNNDIRSIDGIRVTDIIDFRPRVSPYTFNSNRSPFEPSSRIFSSSSTNSASDIAIDQDFTIQYNYYLPRTDILTLSRQSDSTNTGDGVFSIVKGVSSLTPSVPANIPGDAMQVAILKSPAYTFNVDDIKIDYVDNKRYTMRDIGNLETRLSNVEYYTSLNLLELQTRSLAQIDPKTGLNKFQSGFFVDNFSDLSVSDATNSQFRAGLDTKKNILRQQHYTTYLDLQPATNLGLAQDVNYDIRYDTDYLVGTGVIPKKTGNTLSINYTDQIFLKNDISSNHFGQNRGQKINGFNFQNYIGSMELYPSEDVAFHSTITTDQDTNATYKPEIWSSWDLTQYTEQDPDRSLRPRNIEIIAKNLKPYQRYYCYLDGVQVSDLVIPKLIEITMLNNGAFSVGETVIGYKPGENISIRFRAANPKHKYGPYNKPSITFENTPYGNAARPTAIPTTYSSSSTLINVDLASLSEQTTSTFWGGIKVGMILYGTSSGALAQISDQKIVTNGECEFLGSLFIPDFNIYPNKKFSFATKTIILNTDPNSPYTVGKLYGNTARANFNAVNINSPYKVNSTIPTNINNDIGIAQLFEVREPNGIFLTKCEVYFRQKVSTTNLTRSPVTLQIREVENGEPTNKVVEYSNTVTNDNFINVGPQVPTTFTFGSLVYLEPGKSYAITLLTEWPDYEVATSRSTEASTGSAAVLKDMTKFNFTAYGGAGFGDQDYSAARSQGFSDPDIRFFLKCQFSGNIGPNVQERLKDPLWGIVNIPYSKTIPTTGSNAFNVASYGGPGFGQLDYDAAISQKYTDDDIAHYLLNLYTGSIEPAMKTFLVNYSKTKNLFGTVATSGGNVPSAIPRVGSLFVTNGSSWQEVLTDKLTFKLFRAKFDTKTTTSRFMNPELSVGNKQSIALRPNALTTYSRKIKVGLSTTFTLSQTGISVGNNVLQTNNANFNGVIESLVGPVGLNSTLSITSAGIGFTSTPKVYNNIPLNSLTGVGVGARVNLSIGSGGVAVAATVSQSGTGYAIGDSLTIDNSYTDNLGRDLILTIPNNVGIISTFDTIILDNVQHDIAVSAGDLRFVNNLGVVQTLTNSNPSTSPEVLQDGLHFKVEHSNHGHYAYESYVQLGRLIPDTVPSKITTLIPHTVTVPFTMSLNNVGIFTTFEGLPVGAGNTGYIRVQEEIMAYNSVDVNANTLNIISKGIGGFLPKGYDVDTLVYKYELNGVSLRRIAKRHNLSSTDISKYPVELDNYHVKIDPLDGTYGTVRDGTILPKLYFKSTKVTGPLSTQKSARLTLSSPRSVNYIPYNHATLTTKSFTPNGTKLEARIRSISNTSIDGNEISYVDQGYVDIPINDENGITFESPRVILDRDSEKIILPRFSSSFNKIRYSLSVDFNMETTDDRVSPIIDLNRVGVFLTLDRIDKPISNFIDDPRVNSLTDDPHSSIYISKEIKLKNSADTLSVFLDANISGNSDIRVLYRLLRPDLDDKNEIWQLFPGYNNKDSRGFTIDPDNNDGTADTPYSKTDSFVEYKYSETNLPPFVGFQIKIIMISDTNANNIQIKNLRGIATL